MRLGIAILVMSVAVVGQAGADESGGEWGIGAGLFFSRSDGEATLLRRLSDRTMLGISIQGSRRETDLDRGGTFITRYTRFWSASLGPRLRRFTRPGQQFSPYWDIFLAGQLQESTSESFAERAAGIASGTGFGVEYQTPWSFSVAAHSDWLRVSWTRIERVEVEFPSGARVERDGHQYDTFLGLSPALFVRVYF